MRNQSFWKSSKALLGSVALASALAGGVGYAGATHLEHVHAALALKLASPSEGYSQTGFAPVVKKVLPAVVNIASSKVSKVPTEFQGQLPDDPMFRQFFGNDLNRGFRSPRRRRNSANRASVLAWS
jgi:S1-C subfamily serine protease